CTGRGTTGCDAQPARKNTIKINKKRSTRPTSKNINFASYCLLCNIASKIALRASAFEQTVTRARR
ncbi:MAG: hypothetical protein NTY60_07505, partial [Proteobacteria bacterium]|nr:hypothetical protein [Pseudomonadota bacterium]